MSQQTAFEYIRHGQAPFFRLNTADFSQSGPEAYRGKDVVVLGAPWDGCVTYRSGARFAPYELRRVSALVQSYHPFHGIDVFAKLQAVDGGNIPIPPFNPAGAREIVAAEVAHVTEAGAIPMVVGGDHSVALPVMRALAEAHGPLSVIHIDAHLDTSTAEVWGEKYHHGTPFRNAVEEGLLAKHGLHQIGIRATWGKDDEGDFAKENGAEIYSMERIDDEGIVVCAKNIRKLVGDIPVYLSFDIDGIDPAYAPGTGTPVPGGLSSREALTFMRRLAGINLVGMDLVEVAPSLDHADITLHLASQILYEGIALVALKK